MEPEPWVFYRLQNPSSTHDNNQSIFFLFAESYPNLLTSLLPKVSQEYLEKGKNIPRYEKKIAILASKWFFSKK